MDHHNDNIEDFFRKSLDKLNDTPSDNVWQDLNARLEEDDSKRPYFYWLKYFLPFALLLIGFTAIYFNQQDFIEDYKLQLSEIKEENSALRQDIKVLNQDQEAKQTIEQQFEQQIKTETIFKEKIRTEYVYIKDTIYLTKYVNVPSDNRSRFVTNQNLIDPNSIGLNGNQNIDSQLNNQSSSGNGIGLREISFLTPLSINEYWSTENNTANGTAFTIADRLNLAAKEKASGKEQTKRKKKKPTKGPIIVNNLDPWGRPNFYYRAGLSASLFTTIKGEVSTSGSLGTAYGITQEFGLTTRFSIQAGIYRAFQEYTIGDNSMPLDDQSISNFPEQMNYESQIIGIEVGNTYFDFPVGVKYDFYQDNSKAFFVGSGIKWSIHSGQDFSYFLTDNRVNDIKTNRTFGYLNAVHLSVGIEKSINPFIAYQFSIGSDFGVEPVGIEQQYLNTINAKFNLLFGRK